MKADLDKLMAERDLNALLVMIDEDYSPTVDYLVGHAHVTRGYVLKKINEAPLMVVSPMELEEARSLGITCYPWGELGYGEFLQQHNGSRVLADSAFIKHLLEHFAVAPGKVGIYGTGEFNMILAVIDAVRALESDYVFVGEASPTLFDIAASTKDPDEITRLKSIAARTSEVLQATWDFIGGHRAEGETVVKEDGAPLTIGDVKSFVRRALMDRGLEDTGMIFAQGRDAGFPHSLGQSDMPLQLGQSIVFDLFPRELGGGYYHDVTRTWSIGYATEAVQEAYDQAMEAFDVAVEAYGLGKLTRLVQHAVQDYFEAKGHATLRSDPAARQGYIHGLGHGIGLKIHESPNMHHHTPDDIFEVGNVITIEPGLYYPDEGFGVRVEDALYVAEDGMLVTLTDFHKTLVLPLRG